MENAETIKVNVVYITQSDTNIESVKLYEGENIKDAIEKSGLLIKYPEIDLVRNRVGIFSRICELDDVPKEGDRIEIYRPLIADPKEARRRRARVNKNK